MKPIVLLIGFLVSVFALLPQQSIALNGKINELKLLREKHLRNPPKEIAPVSYQLQRNVRGEIYRPVVLMHGITGDNTTMEEVDEWISEALPGIYIKRIQIGNGFWDSIFMSMNEQVQEFCDTITADENLKDGFNIIAFSQGTLVSRGYIERCNNPPVYNYISWAGPQMGQFGLPFINIPTLDYYLGTVPYWEPVQSWIAPAQFWKDPYNLDDYLESSLYLADLNNERETKNQDYKAKITSLNFMVLIYSLNDSTITPRESGWFSFFAPNTQEVIPVQETDFYKDDWIGIRTLDESDRIYWGKTDCIHNQHAREPCKPYFYLHTLPYLNNTLPNK